MPAREVFQSLADAISGTDREAAYRKGVAERSDIDYTQAQTEAAMQLARDRRLGNEEKERMAAAREALREEYTRLGASGSQDQAGIDPFAVMESGFGDEYAGQQLGRGRAQEYNLRETISTPSMGMGLGDEIDPAIAHEYEREAALEALSPSSALASRRMDTNMEMVLQPDGSSIYVPRPQAAGQPVGARPSSATGSAANAGGISSAVSGLIYRQSAGVYGGTYDPVSGRFAGLDRESAANVQRLASRASVIFKQGGVDPQTAVDQALNEMKSAAAAGGTIPPQFGDELPSQPALGPQGAVDPFEGRTATGPNGEKLVKLNGVWQPVR
jgi:hypothetical protein